MQLEMMELVILQNINRKPVLIEENGWQRIYDKLEKLGLIAKAITRFTLSEVSIVAGKDKRYAGAVGGNIGAMAWQITETGKTVLRNALPLHSNPNIVGGTFIR